MSMDSFELSKIAGGCLRASRHRRLPHHIRDRRGDPPKRSPGLRFRCRPSRRPPPSPERRRGPRSGRLGRLRSGPSGQGVGDRQRAEGCDDLQEVSGVPLGDERRTQQGGSQSGRCRRPPEGGHEGFNYSDALKAKGGNWTLEDFVLRSRPQDVRSRHQDAFSRHCRRERPGRSARLFEHCQVRRLRRRQNDSKLTRASARILRRCTAFAVCSRGASRWAPPPSAA